MILSAFRSGLYWALALHVLGAGAAGAEDRGACTTLARKIQKEVSAKPERVLIIIEDALVVDDACACEVVKAGIVGSKARPKLVGHIVFTAITASPRSAATVAECAAAVSPDAAAEIKAAVAKALGGVAAAPPAPAAPPPASSDPADPQAAPASAVEAAPAPASTGKDPASSKNPAATPAPAPTTDDFTLSPVTIGGVYLVYPGGGGSRIVRDSHGHLVLLGPDGRPHLIDDHPPRTSRPSPPKTEIIIIRPPTATSSNDPPAP